MTSRARPMPKVPGRSERALQEQLEHQRRQARTSALDDARLVEGIVVPPTGTIKVQHGLGRMLKRVLTFLPSAATTAPLYEVVATRSESEFEIGNNGAQEVTVDILVM